MRKEQSVSSVSGCYVQNCRSTWQTGPADELLLVWRRIPFVSVVFFFLHRFDEPYWEFAVVIDGRRDGGSFPYSSYGVQKEARRPPVHNDRFIRLASRTTQNKYVFTKTESASLNTAHIKTRVENAVLCLSRWSNGWCWSIRTRRGEYCNFCPVAVDEASAGAHMTVPSRRWLLRILLTLPADDGGNNTEVFIVAQCFGSCCSDARTHTPEVSST